MMTVICVREKKEARDVNKISLQVFMPINNIRSLKFRRMMIFARFSPNVENW